MTPSNRALIKSLVQEVVQEISADTMRAAGEKARSVDKPTQANRFYDAAEKKAGTDRVAELDKALAGAPKKIGARIPSLGSFMSEKASEIELTGLYRRDGSTHIEFSGGGVFGLGKVKGEIIVTKDGKFYALDPKSDQLPISTKFDRNGVISMHKITGIPNANIPKVDELREGIKTAIKKLVLSEMTKADYGVGKASTCSELVKELDKAVKKAAGEVASVVENPLGNKIVFDDGRDGGKFQVELYRKTDNGERFDLVAFFQGSERFTVKDMTKESVLEFIKDNLKVDENCKSYTEKALSKGKAPIDPEGKKAEKNSEKAKEETEEISDESEEADGKTQKDIADKDDADADGDDVEIEDDVTPQLGGELVDKIEKIIDKVLKGKQVKADAKSPFLKADKDMESPDKLVVKAKETPKLKEKKS